jgi:pimeloyl-ACP methyl ester carboxylesterase
VVALAPPGFGAPVPAGFGATSDDYLTWLAQELHGIPGPIDLIGHDWGGIHVLRLAASRPELVRSWATDVAGAFDPTYVWHEVAQVWQTKGAGEAAVAQLVATPKEQLVRRWMGFGMSEHAATATAAAFGEETGRCILALYRSAAQPKMAEWGADLSKAKTRPGVVILPTENQGTLVEYGRRTAERAGAQVALLEGLGHFWMCQDPKRGAEMLRCFVAVVATS